MIVPLATPSVPRPAAAADLDAATRALDGVLAAQDGPALRDQLTAPTVTCTDEVCVTCSDEGRVAEVLAPSADGMATVRTAAGEETVLTLLVEPVAPGDLLLVHAGTAIARLEES